MHALLRRHWVRSLLCRLLLLQISLILKSLLLVSSHVRLGWCLVAHALRHALRRHWWRGRVLLLWRLDS